MTPKTITRAKIAGHGKYVPPKVITNFDLEKMVDTTDEWIRTRTGIQERHVIEDGQSTSDMSREASLEAMRQAVLQLVPLPDAVLVDGFRIPGLFIPQHNLVRGDVRCAAIAAASIVAKVYRDHLMAVLHEDDPRYGFDRHKGYATADHLAAVARYGYSPVHRRSFRPPSLFETID
jgi:ribonuclease HII